MCKYAVKKLPDLLRYVPDQYKTQQMCYKAILENGKTLKSTLNFYKNQEMFNKTVDNYPHPLEFVPKCHITQKCHKAVSTYPYTINFVSECFMTQEMCNKAVHRCFLYLILFLINMNLKKYVIELFLKILF